MQFVLPGSGSLVLVTGPSHGSLTVNANGSFSYSPAADFTGSDAFSYRASDGTLTSNVATVTLSVTAVNDAPTAAVAAGGTCGTDDRSGTINFTVGDVESAATALTLTAVSSNPTLLPAGNIVFAGSGAARTLTARTVAGRTGTSGGDGNDIASGGAGKDNLAGAGGDDRLTGGLGADRLSGGPGKDRATDYGAAEGDTTDGTIP